MENCMNLLFLNFKNLSIILGKEREKKFTNKFSKYIETDNNKRCIINLMLYKIFKGYIFLLIYFIIILKNEYIYEDSYVTLMWSYNNIFTRILSEMNLKEKDNGKLKNSNINTSMKNSPIKNKNMDNINVKSINVNKLNTNDSNSNNIMFYDVLKYNEIENNNKNDIHNNIFYSFHNNKNDIHNHIFYSLNNNENDIHNNIFYSFHNNTNDNNGINKGNNYKSFNDYIWDKNMDINKMNLNSDLDTITRKLESFTLKDDKIFGRHIINYDYGDDNKICTYSNEDKCNHVNCKRNDHFVEHQNIGENEMTCGSTEGIDDLLRHTCNTSDYSCYSSDELEDESSDENCEGYTKMEKYKMYNKYKRNRERKRTNENTMNSNNISKRKNRSNIKSEMNNDDRQYEEHRINNAQKKNNFSKDHIVYKNNDLFKKKNEHPFNENSQNDYRCKNEKNHVRKNDEGTKILNSTDINTYKESSNSSITSSDSNDSTNGSINELHNYNSRNTKDINEDESYSVEQSKMNKYINNKKKNQNSSYDTQCLDGYDDNQYETTLEETPKKNKNKNNISSNKMNTNIKVEEVNNKEIVFDEFEEEILEDNLMNFKQYEFHKTLSEEEFFKMIDSLDDVLCDKDMLYIFHFINTFERKKYLIMQEDFNIYCEWYSSINNIPVNVKQKYMIKISFYQTKDYLELEGTIYCNFYSLINKTFEMAKKDFVFKMNEIQKIWKQYRFEKMKYWKNYLCSKLKKYKRNANIRRTYTKYSDLILL
ncbi:Plasmodium exported protein (PHISTc), unknown function [Plasmodium sp. DRC-Itaito]|nr:Plasmodium exported protein (PHISTc), unknown function [Plasmodium sp. DRC-Itaito]